MVSMMSVAEATEVANAENNEHSSRIERLTEVLVPTTSVVDPWALAVALSIGGLKEVAAELKDSTLLCASHHQPTTSCVILEFAHMPPVGW
jgi:hypothetical protein